MGLFTGDFGEDLKAKDERIKELEEHIQRLERSQAADAEATAKSIILLLGQGKHPTGNSNVEFAIKQRLAVLEEERNKMDIAAGDWSLLAGDACDLLREVKPLLPVVEKEAAMYCEQDPEGADRVLQYKKSMKEWYDLHQRITKMVEKVGPKVTYVKGVKVE